MNSIDITFEPIIPKKLIYILTNFSMSNLLRDALYDIIPDLDDDPMVSMITNIPSCELRIVVQFVMFGRIPPGRPEDSYIPSKGRDKVLF